MSSASTVPPLLLPEALGFSPHLLIDDIINNVNFNVIEGVNGMETFLQNWADRRSEKAGDWDSMQESEQGLVAFQTLLEYHTDIAFDFFEAWALKNIFSIPPNLPIVLPHQQNLDLNTKPERVQELMDEIAALRAKLDNQRRLQRLFVRALRVSKNQRLRAEKRLDHLSMLDSPRMDLLAELPSQLIAMHEAVSNLPPLDNSTIASMTAEPGKRQWETSKVGYVNWAVSQLLARARADENAQGSTTVDEISRRAAEVGKPEQLRQAFEITKNVREGLQNVQTMMETQETDV